MYGVNLVVLVNFPCCYACKRWMGTLIGATNNTHRVRKSAVCFHKSIAKQEATYSTKWIKDRRKIPLWPGYLRAART